MERHVIALLGSILGLLREIQDRAELPEDLAAEVGATIGYLAEKLRAPR